MSNGLTPIEGSETESTLCCGYKACLKKLNQEYLDAKCVGCTEIDYAKEWEKLKRYIELDKLRTTAINCGDDIYASTIAIIQNEICFPGAPERITYGCTDPTASLYNPIANEPCVVNGVINGCCTEQTSLILGCTDVTSSNYNPLATYDDGSCDPCVYGCMDNNASNYDAGATCDDGSCIRVIPTSSNCNWRIGDTGPAGGIIFYISPTNSDDETTYLECSRYDIGVGKEWGCLGDVIGQTFPDILMGQVNTDIILASCADPATAAELCDSHSNVHDGRTFDDWYLPSKEEMETIYFHLHAQGMGQFAGGYYWTSTENTVTSWASPSGTSTSMLPTGANPADYAWSIDFYSATSNFVQAVPNMKSISSLNVRAVRQFTCGGTITGTTSSFGTGGLVQTSSPPTTWVGTPPDPYGP